MRDLIGLIQRWHLLFYFKCSGWVVDEALDEASKKLSNYKVKGLSVVK